MKKLISLIHKITYLFQNSKQSIPNKIPLIRGNKRGLSKQLFLFPSFQKLKGTVGNNSLQGINKKNNSKSSNIFNLQFSIFNLSNSSYISNQKPKKEGKYSFPTKSKLTSSSEIFCSHFLVFSELIFGPSFFQKQKTKNQKLLGFTLVELIVVITILSILGTISFVSFNNYTKGARDSTRISDISSISKGLGIYQAKVGRYPLPDKSVKIYGSGELCGYQGEAGTTIANIINLSSIGGKDPLYQSNYTYNTNAGFDKHQMLTFLEDKASIVLDFQPFQNLTTTYATEYINKFPYVRGDLLGIIINYSTGSKNESIYTPLQDTGTGIDFKNPTIDQKVITANNLTLTGVDMSIKPNYIKLIPIDGVCGSAINTSYTGGSAVIIGTFCTSGVSSISDTSFVGNTKTWDCKGIDNGLDINCSISKNSCNTPLTWGTGFVIGDPLLSNMPWQNSNPSNPCYFSSCTNAHTGTNCSDQDSNVSLLMHFDGNYSDSSGKISGANGTNGQLTTTGIISKFGGYSLAPSVSTLSYLKVPEPTNSLLNFGGGDFTIDFWLYPKNNTTGGIYGKRTESAGVYDGIVIVQELGPKIRILSSPNSGWNIDYTQNTNLNMFDWNHVAIIRYGTELSIYINGNKNIVSNSFGGSIKYWSNVDATIGAPSLAGATYPQYQGYDGYIDEFRIVKGEAVRISSFSVPLVAY